ncbi:MAG: endopeptidase La [Lachnospiraceae bacterium]|nr:endopeptidase La [Lachnospiraceae bacterium]
MNDEMKLLPAIALRGTTILPGMIVHFDISREKSVKAVEEAMVRDQEIFLVGQKESDNDEPGILDVYRVGTIAHIKQVVKLKKDVLRILVEGLERAEVISFEHEDEYLEAEVALFDKTEEIPVSGNAKDAMLRSMRDIFKAYCRENGNVSNELSTQLLEIEDVEKLVDQISINLHLTFEHKQQLLEAVPLSERYELLGVLLSNEIEVMQIRKDLQMKVKERIDKGQREYILREQLKLIREELGEDHTVTDIDNFKKAVQKLKATKEIKDKIIEEIDRFQNIGNNSSESAVMRGYIETLLSLPWDKASKDNTDLKRAKDILEADHYGLEKVKERILEFLAVRSLTKKGDSPILCLVGPPGTGKTSIGRSIASALNKKYVRLSLGGVRDEAEIRGHRRTYVGAMPGRIARGLKQAGVKNPLMVLDEIDKVSSDYKGDVASAMLEVLDSEQNSHFSDHYVELPLDLSEVLFLATANDIQAIPRPLLDRMEIIEVTSYTENEKQHIAKEHLIPKQMDRHGLKNSQLEINDTALASIIAHYTKEAGVRSLERKVGEICRKAARQIMEEKKEKVSVTTRNLTRYLGNGRYTYQMANAADEIGIVRGLAWTSVGGDTLQIEVNIMPGKGEFLLTGQLGDVMKESAQAGISYIRSVAKTYDIPLTFFQKHDIHIHIPEGAVPKDGPSAGITMAAAMLSAITETPVKADVAMTGEITLRGRVLPIGGLKEKLLAAKNARIKTVLVPAENKKDVGEVSREITGGLRIVYVETMSEVLEEALAK